MSFFIQSGVSPGYLYVTCTAWKGICWHHDSRKERTRISTNPVQVYVLLSKVGRWGRSQTICVCVCPPTLQTLEAEADADAIPHSLPRLGLIPGHFRGDKSDESDSSRCGHRMTFARAFRAICQGAYDRQSRHSSMLPGLSSRSAERQTIRGSGPPG